jgi:hypothetical protein
MSHPAVIAPAGCYLLSVLTAEGPVTYRRFYDHSPGRDREVAEGILARMEQPEEDELDRLLEEGHLLVEWAAWQLQDFAAVTITPLTTLLPDGEPDYRIELTEKGRELVGAPGAFKYRSLGSGFYAGGASEWLIVFAETNSDEPEPFEFHLVREVGFSDGEVRVTDDCGNVYPPGTRPYDWAFEVALWHHFRSGDFELTYESDEQENAWLDFCRSTAHLFQHHEFPASCLRVCYRLSEKALANPDGIQRVGWIGRE